MLLFGCEPNVPGGSDGTGGGDITCRDIVSVGLDCCRVTTGGSFAKTSDSIAKKSCKVDFYMTD